MKRYPLSLSKIEIKIFKMSKRVKKRFLTGIFQLKTKRLENMKARIVKVCPKTENLANPELIV